MKKLIRRFRAWLGKYDLPFKDELVLKLTLSTAGIALKKDEYVEFAPIAGTCGTFRLYGNSLPCFVYTVFEKKLMEFIKVRVEISKPDRIHFISKIESTDPTQDGKEVETKEKYKAPFNTLAAHLFNYFPYPMEGGRKHEEPTQEIQVQDSVSPRPEAISG